MWFGTFAVIALMVTGLTASTINLPKVLEAAAIEPIKLSNVEVAEQIKIARGYYTQAVVSKIVKSGNMVASYNHRDDPKAIPLPATFVKDISELLRQRETTLALVSPYPWPHRADRRLDDFELSAWDAFQSDPSSVFTRLETLNGKRILRVAVADRMTSQACVDCHNSDPLSAKRDWKVGDVRAVMEVTKVVEPYLQAAEARAHNINLIAGGICGAASLSLLVVTGLVARRTREKEQSDGRLHHLAFHDALTGTANRVLLSERLSTALAGASEDRQVAVVCLDLDRFKQVNDTLGHSAGDLLLKLVAQRLKSAVKSGDTVARLGGDEFVIVATDIETIGEIESWAQRLHDTIARDYEIDGHAVSIDASIGVAIAPQDGDTSETLLAKADFAAYQAKAARGGLCFFEQKFHAQWQHRRKLEADLANALERDELEVHFQPIYDIETMRVVSFEALLRWRHGEFGMVPPSVFIPIAEEMHIIDGIGEWALTVACRVATSWPEEVSLKVNLSPLQFRNQKVVPAVLLALASSGLRPQRLELEVTESALMHDEAVAATIMQQLRTFGIRMALDDFGTGFSSLSYLHAYTFDTLKIDRRFTADVSSGKSRGTMIMEAAVTLARRFGMDTVAEGVETRQQLECVRKLGCAKAQGFLFSGAVSACDATRMVSHDIRAEAADLVA